MLTTSTCVFRDPPAEADEAGPLRLAIARALLGAPALPVDLPAHGMRLLDVEADRRGIGLVVGFEDPVARLRLAAAASAPVAVRVERLAALGAAHVDQALARMAKRVARATTAARWEEAQPAARRLAELPTGIPLGYFRQVVAGLDPAHSNGLVRTGFRCNQDCGMCWQDRAWGGYGPEQILRWIEDLRAATPRLSISGGEPTLDPDLRRYLARARELGFTDRVIETNAVLCGKPGVAQRLREAGLTAAFVSLHSPDAAASDRITRAPGTHARTVRGIHALLEAGVEVVLNAVATAQGIEHLPALPDFVHRELGGRVSHLMISFPTLPHDEALAPEVLPAPGALREALRATIERSVALGVRLAGLDGPCGPALCAFDADPRIVDLHPVAEALDFRVHLPGCDQCAVRHACFGVRREQVDRFGEACIAPLSALPLRPHA